MPPELKVTSGLLYLGALVFALLDAVCVPLLARWIDEAAFRRLKWPLVIAAALVWFGIWSWAISNYWGTVYSYVFPTWARTWVPWIALIAAGLVSLGLWTLSRLTMGRPVLTYCLLGGVLGILTHLWAVQRGIVTRPPMLQGASPLPAVVIAFFEFTFYFCIILTLAGSSSGQGRYSRAGRPDRGNSARLLEDEQFLRLPAARDRVWRLLA